MKKIITVIYTLSFVIGAVSAQSVYDGVKIADKDLNGTARFVGMGGAMGALGGDITTMGTNPAGIGIYRSNDCLLYTSAIDSLALKARDNKLMPEDIDGGTFTITNFGTFKSLFGTPIINQPQVAILGVGYIEKKPAVVETPEGDTIAIRHKMYLSLSYDHRVVDGMLGGNFLHFIADYLENWKG